MRSSLSEIEAVERSQILRFSVSFCEMLASKLWVSLIVLICVAERPRR